MQAKTRFFASILLLTSALSACARISSPQSPATPEAPIRVLFIGNSVTYWNNGLDHHLEQLAAAANPPRVVQAESATRGGASLETLWKYTKAVEEIGTEAYDVVVLQEDIQLTTSWKQSASVDSFHEYARNFDAEIKEAGAKTVLFMAWPFESDNAALISTEALAQAHRKIADELGAEVAPVALVFDRAMAERPELDVYDFDGLHPSIYGTYLATSVLYATLLGESPVDLSYLPPESTYMLSNGKIIDGSTEDEATFLRNVAWETVQAYQAEQ